jgi:CRISPR-associated protein Cmr4
LESVWRETVFRKAGMLFLYTETPLHAGSGTSVAGVDLPIQRERHTQYPMIQASGLKGAFRDLTEQIRGITPEEIKRLSDLRKKETLNDKEQGEKQGLERKIVPVEVVFGPETDRASVHGGALAFTDARILLFPVRSLVGVFAWVTCPTVIERFRRDLRQVGQGLDVGDLSPPAKDEVFVPRGCIVQTPDGQVVLEDSAFQVNRAGEGQVTTLASWLAEHALPPAYRPWRDRLRKALVVVGDDVFRDFVRFSTEILFRVRIGETGTVERGALWSEEHLPSDTLLYSLALATDPKDRDLAKPHGLENAEAILNFLKNVLGQASMVQLGGDETVGRGIVQVTYYP